MSVKLPVFKSLLSVWPYLPRSEKWRFGLLMVLAAIMAVADLALTGLVALLAAIFASPEAVLKNPAIIAFQGVTNITLTPGARYLSFIVLIGILATIVLKNAFALAQQWELATLSERISLVCRSKIFRFYQKAPFGWITRAGIGELYFGLQAGMQMGVSLMTGLQILTNLLMIVTFTVGLLAVFPALSIIFLVGMALLGAGVVRAIRNLLNRLSQAKYEADFKQTVIIQLAINGLKEFRIYTRENILYQRYTERLAESAVAGTKYLTFGRLSVFSLEIFAFACLVMVLALLLFVLESGMARISGIMGFLAAATWRALPVANRLVDAITSIRQAAPYIQKAVSILELEKTLSTQTIDLAEPDKAALPFNEQIAVNNIHYTYENATVPALDGVSMVMDKGKMVGVIGVSGSGKSTLVNLLTGLLVPDEGAISIDGQTLCRENIRNWLPHIGYVAQAPYIMDASLAENIALSRWGESIDRERVMAVCKMAALDFVDKLENGVDTRLGERGVILSGGQAQRVAIARALYHEPEFIIFDEATSSLDLKNENAIYDTILSLKNQVTMLVVAHRLATVQGCDHIVWLENGKLKMQGTPEEVLPIYREYMGKQATNATEQVE